MKGIKKLLVIMLTIIMLAGCLMMTNSVNAVIWDSSTNAELNSSTVGVPTRAQDYDKIVKKSDSKFVFNVDELLLVYTLNSTDRIHPRFSLKDVQQIPTTGLIAMYHFVDGAVNELGWHDSIFDANDESSFTALATGTSAQTVYYDDVKLSLAKVLGISKDDIEVVVNVSVPKITGVTEAFSYELRSSDQQISADTQSKIALLGTIKKLFVDEDENYIRQESVTVKAVLTNGAEYSMVVGSDNNFYLLKTKDETVTPPPSGEEVKFETVLSYKAFTSEGKEVSGREEKGVFYPPYYDNENQNAKKDTDATAYITSQTEETIVKVNDVALTESNTKQNPNSEGWYYPDLTNKKIVAKDYPFDTYNNPTDNGVAKESKAVKVTGDKDGVDYKNPKIVWTLRRINYDEKVTEDGTTKTVTVTITYNLPIDENSIPDGWSKIVDNDGGIRKITRTFKEGEDYDKDVTVKQNGDSDKTVTTPVSVKWQKAPYERIVQTGSFTATLLAIIAGIAVVAYTRFRKLNK